MKPTSAIEESNGYYFDNLTIKVEGNNEDYSAYILRYFYGEETETPEYTYQGLSGYIEYFLLTETSFGLDFIDTSLMSKSMEEACKYTVKTDCGLSGHHSSLDEPSCSSNILTVRILQECFETGVKTISTGNYSSETGGKPSFGGGKKGTASPIISPYDELELGKLDGIRNLLNLTSSEYTWLYSKYSTAMAIWDFLENDASIEAKEFANEIIDSGLDNTLVSPFPFIKYPLNSNYESVYPKFTEYLKNKLPNVTNIPKIISTIKIITGHSESQIKEDLTWGNGPTIHITQLDNYSSNTSSKAAGLFSSDEPYVIHIDIDYVNELEDLITDQSQEDAFLFFLGTTILHEYVHYGDN